MNLIFLFETTPVCYEVTLVYRALFHFLSYGSEPRSKILLHVRVHTCVLCFDPNDQFCKDFHHNLESSCCFLLFSNLLLDWHLFCLKCSALRVLSCSSILIYTVCMFALFRSRRMYIRVAANIQVSMRLFKPSNSQLLF